MRFLWFCIVVCLWACTPSYEGVPEKYHALLQSALAKAGDNAGQWKKALKDSPAEQKEGVAFLVAYMPEPDLKELTAAFLLKNVDYAYRAKQRFPWTGTLPDSVFFNEVLPYACMNETRDDWRADFYERFSRYVENCKTLEEAIDSVNRNIRDEVQVDYNTKREKPDQSPYESMRQGMASCSGLSILLTDAFRAVGIPSRVAGTPNWHDNRGNHNWCEVWIDGKWYFTEYYPNRLNEAWFFADAGKAKEKDPEHAIYATSYKLARDVFPLVWDRNIRYVYAENVTGRYVDLYRAYASSLMNDGKHVRVKVSMFRTPVCTLNSDDRVAANVDVFCGEEQMGGGRTSGPHQDMNEVLEFLLEKNKTYTFLYADAAGQEKRVKVEVGEEPAEVKLYMKSGEMKKGKVGK